MEVLLSGSVKGFLESLDQSLRERAQRMIDLLRTEANALRMPYSKSIGKGLFEIRILGNEQIRIIYFFHNRQAVLLHAFFKKTMRISRKDMKTALQVKKTFNDR